MQLVSVQPQQSESHAVAFNLASASFRFSANHNLNGIILSAKLVGRVRGK